MSRSKSSTRWLREHFSDPFVKKSKQEGHRSRAAYKLLEIQKRDALIKMGMTVIELGAAPGGWTPLLVEWAGDAGCVIVTDILEIDPVQGALFIQGDFEEQETVDKVLQAMPASKADAVISDMAPNMSGITSADHARSMRLTECAVDLAERVLKSGGVFLTKTFEGADLAALIQRLRKLFKIVTIRKPEASRQRSRELYLVAKGYKNGV